MLQPVTPGSQYEHEPTGPGQLDDVAENLVNLLNNLQERVAQTLLLRNRAIARMSAVIKLPEPMQHLTYSVDREHPELPLSVPEQFEQRAPAHGYDIVGAVG